MDEIAAYKSKLHEALKKEMAAPISCRSVSNCTMLMDAICAADKLSDKPSTYAQHFEREEAMQWADRMQNADGSTGPHWTMEQTTAIADSMGIPCAKAFQPRQSTHTGLPAAPDGRTARTAGRLQTGGRDSRHRADP